MNKVTQELSRIAARHNGLLYPEDVVEAAKDPQSPLHSKFEWDDTKAAESHRIWQARHLIKMSVNVIGGLRVPYFVSVTVDRNNSGGYRTITSVLKDENKRAQMLQDALEDLRLFKKKYALLTELAEVFDAIKKVDK